MKYISEDMKPDFKDKEIKKQNIFIEFSLSDIDYIKKLPNFTDAWEYVNTSNILHKREFGYIETKDAFIRFLSNDFRIWIKLNQFEGYLNDNDPPKDKEASKSA